MYRIVVKTVLGVEFYSEEIEDRSVAISTTKYLMSNDTVIMWVNRLEYKDDNGEWKMM